MKNQVRLKTGIVKSPKEFNHVLITAKFNPSEERLAEITSSAESILEQLTDEDLKEFEEITLQPE